MTTTQLLDGETAVKHVLLTNRAICLDAFLSALMFVDLLSRHTCVALHTMKEVDAQSFALTADVAELAVIDIFVWLTIVQSANAAVVTCKGDFTGDALV